MPANYLHGVEVLTIQSGARPVNVVKSAVIGLVGIAPAGPRQALTLVNSLNDASQFGADIKGTTIPRALQSIFAQGAGTVLVVNVMADEFKSTSTSESHTVTNGKFNSTYAPISAVTVKNADASVTYVKDTDYTVDEYGYFRSLTIANAATVKLTYDYISVELGDEDLALAVIGEVDNGVRTGFQLFDIARGTYGFDAKIFICPELSPVEDIMAQMIITANKFKGHAIIDGIENETVTNVIADRGVGGGRNTSDKRVILLDPYSVKGKIGDPRYSGDDQLPFSSFFAGVVAAVDLNEGYWVSPSNHEIKGISGVEVIRTGGINDATGEINLLNEAGYVAIFQGYGTGIRTWGNRSAAFPTNTLPENFICIQRTADVIDESIVQAMLPFIDRPINNAIIDSITETVNAFLRTQVQRGAIIDGNCWYDPNHNSAEELAAGHIVFDYDFMPPTPAERITFRSFINIDYLKSLGA